MRGIPLFRYRCLGFGCALLLFAPFCAAGMRGTGTYCGVVIFDRWDACTLYSGVYLMYIAQNAREPLRAMAGQCVQIDTTDVWQPMNPGDGLIKKFTLLGPPPAGNFWYSPKGLNLSISPTFKNGERPVVRLRIENTTDDPITVDVGSLAPTLLGRKDDRDTWGPADGPSTAVITRETLDMGMPPMHGANDTWQWTVTSPKTMEKKLIINQHDTFEATLAFTLPAGEYDFFAGYGGGVHESLCIASNQIDFDVDAAGHGTLVKPAPPVKAEFFLSRLLLSCGILSAAVILLRSRRLWRMFRLRSA